MRRISILKDGTEYDCDKQRMYDTLSKKLANILGCPMGTEGRIAMPPSSCRMAIYITGNSQEESRRFAKTLLGYAEKAGVRTSFRSSDRPNCYGAVIYDCTDNVSTGDTCTAEQREEMFQQWSRHKGVSIVVLPYSNYSDNLMSSYGDGYYVQLGKEIKKSVTLGY